MEAKTPSEIETACLTEINEVLKKHNCIIDVSFSQDSVLGQPVLKYHPIILFKGEQQKGETK